MFSPLRKNPKRSGFKSPRDPISNDFISTSTSTLHPNDPPGYPEHSSHYIKPVPPRYITEYERAYTWPKQFGEEPKDEMKEEKGKDIVPKDLSTSNNIDRYSDLEDIIHHHRHFIKPIEPTYVTEYERAYCSAGNTPQSSPKGTLNKDLMFDKSFEHPSDESPYSPLKLQTKIRDIATTDKNITKINDEKNEIKNIKSDKIENKDISQEKVTISEVWIEMEKIIDELNKKGYLIHRYIYILRFRINIFL